MNEKHRSNHEDDMVRHDPPAANSGYAELCRDGKAHLSAMDESIDNTLSQDSELFNKLNKQDGGQ